MKSSWAALHIAAISELRKHTDLCILPLIPTSSNRLIHSSMSRLLPIDLMDVAVS